MRFASLFAISLSFIATSALAQDVDQTEQPTAAKTYQEKDWGLAFLMRHADIAFNTEDEQVSSVVPMIYYEGSTFFMRGIEGGAHLYQQDDWQINAIGRMRFFDIPQEYQNAVQGDSVDFGFQWRKKYSENGFVVADVMSDLDGRLYSNLTGEWRFRYGDFDFKPSVTATLKSADFNSRYYALDVLTGESINAGVEFNAKVETRYHVTSNFYLLGSIGVTALDNQAYDSFAIADRYSTEAYFGFGLSNDDSKPRSQSLDTLGYVRVAHGWATPSDLGNIIRGDIEKDEFNNQMTSVFFGVPLTDSLFSLPISVYLTPGAVWHWSSDVQDSEQEYILAVKAYYNFNWPIRWRIGAAEGLSYVSDVTYIERKEMIDKGYRPSKLMNYLDVSLDFNLGDLINTPSLKDTWLGYSIHHRSSIFESSSVFGRIKGGSNYYSFYVQMDF